MPGWLGLCKSSSSLQGSVQACARPPRRASSGLPRNTVVLFVPQQEAWVVERMGRFHRILEPVRTASAHHGPA